LCSFYPILFSFYRHHRDLHSFPTRRSSDLVLSLGFLLIVSLIVNGLLMVFMDYVTRLLSDLVVYLSIALDAIINFIVISALFGVIFKFLPAVRIKWKDVRAGAFFTALL